MFSAECGTFAEEHERVQLARPATDTESVGDEQKLALTSQQRTAHLYTIEDDTHVPDARFLVLRLLRFFLAFGVAGLVWPRLTGLWCRLLLKRGGAGTALPEARRAALICINAPRLRVPKSSDVFGADIVGREIANFTNEC